MVDKAEESHKTKVFIYGSIKCGFYNHSRFGFNQNTNFLGEAVLKRAKMYNLGSYPCIVLTENENDLVYGELYEYLDSETERQIRLMEEGAGYKEVKVIINGIEAKTFVFNKPSENSALIESGKWTKQ